MLFKVFYPPDTHEKYYYPHFADGETEAQRDLNEWPKVPQEVYVELGIES